MIYATKSDIGPVRYENQDNAVVEYLDKNTLLAIVCDGMGGHSFGREASLLAAEIIKKRILDGYNERMETNSLRNLMITAINTANTIIYEKSKAVDNELIMGTTCTLAIVRDKLACIANVGDSRAYKVGETIEQITHDHTLINKLISEGKMNKDDSIASDIKNMITRAIGADKDVNADYFETDLKNGDKMLLCTDGLTGNCSDDLIFNIISGENIDRSIEKLISAAIENGCTDNVTATIVEI